jgi:hypothetical protein
MLVWMSSVTVSVASPPTSDRAAVRNSIGVQHGDDIGGDVLQAVVDVAGLGVAAIGTGQVVRAELARQCGDLGTVAVVEHPRLVRQPYGGRGGDRRQQDLGRLVVGRYQDGEAQVGPLHVRRRGHRVQVPQAGGVQE